ncbi:hypothetical protein, partial [Thermostichus sp. OS-CIW-29]
MSELERSLFQHGIEMSGWLLPPLEATEEDPPEAGVPGTGNPLQAQVSFPELLPNTLGATLHQFAERLGCVDLSFEPKESTDEIEKTQEVPGQFVKTRT